MLGCGDLHAAWCEGCGEIAEVRARLIFTGKQQAEHASLGVVGRAGPPRGSPGELRADPLAGVCSGGVTAAWKVCPLIRCVRRVFSLASPVGTVDHAEDVPPRQLVVV